MAPPAPKQPRRDKQQQPKPTTIDLIGGIYCSICKNIFPNKKDYDEHYLKHNLSSRDISYTCLVCYKEILGYASFRGHCYTAHIIKSRFNCKICNKNFSKQTALTEHEESMHNFKCPSPCNKEFSSKQELQLHQIIHKDNGPPYPCQTCSNKLSSLDSCEKHVDLHTTYKYPCPICSETFTDRATAGKHLTQHFEGETQSLQLEQEIQANDCATNQLGIHCGMCDEIFKSKTDIDMHFESEHNGTVLYECTLCGGSFEKYLTFANHCYNHVIKEKFRCEKCDKTFGRLSLLVSHSRQCTSGPRKPLPCAHCDALFADNRRLRLHSKEVHDVDAFQCTEDGCGKLFQTMRELVLHQIVHSTNETYCQNCGLEFLSLSSCEKHLDVHRIPSLPCPVCDKRFTDKSIATKHVSQHFQSVFHVCKICGKIYNAKHRLAEHIKSHSESRSHECDYCGKGFPTPENLKQHINTHTGVKPYKCVGCEKAFTSYPNLYKHLKRMHNIDPKSLKKNPAPTKDVPITKDVPKVTDAESKESNPTESLDLESNPDMLEEALMYVVESIASDNSMELENIDPSVLENVGDDFGVEVDTLENGLQGFDQAPENSLQTSGPDWSIPAQAQASSSSNFPREYGPDFINYQGLDISTHNHGSVIELDDHILPHIDPLLTIKEQNLETVYCDNVHTNNATYENFETPAQPTFNEKWEPPIITKLYQNYAFVEMPNISANILSVLQTDIY